KVNLINWRKLTVLFFVLLFVSLLIYLIFMYRTILEGKLEGVDETTSIVSQSLNMKVDEVYFFQEKEGYHIAFTKDENNDEWIVFVPLEDEIKKENFILLEKEDVLSKEEIESKWQQNCTQCELIDSTP